MLKPFMSMREGTRGQEMTEKGKGDNHRYRRRLEGRVYGSELRKEERNVLKIKTSKEGERSQMVPG